MGDCIYKGFDIYFMFLTYVTCSGGNLCVIKECVTMFVCQKFITFLHEQNFEMILFVATSCFRVFYNSQKSRQHGNQNIFDTISPTKNVSFLEYIAIFNLNY